jgi:hypothetical protein
MDDAPRVMAPGAETRWAVRALRRARDRMASGMEEPREEFWSLDPEALFVATAEALMWVVMLNDWYERDYPDRYKGLAQEHKSLLLGLRWARNRALHQFALLTGFVRRWPDETTIHPGWQHRDVLPPVLPEHDRGGPQYEGRVAGRRLLDPIDQVTKWFEGWVEIELKPIDER